MVRAAIHGMRQVSRFPFDIASEDLQNIDNAIDVNRDDDDGFGLGSVRRMIGDITEGFDRLPSGLQLSNLWSCLRCPKLSTIVSASDIVSEKKFVRLRINVNYSGLFNSNTGGSG